MKVRSAGRQQGSALLLTLIIGSILGMTLGAYLELVYFQNRMIIRSQAWNYEIAVAEAGLEEALTHLYYNLTNMSAEGWTLSNGSYTKERKMTEGRYVVAISNANPPVIYGHGYATIPGTTNYMAPRTIRLTVSPNARFKKGMVAKGQIDMSGNNLKTDSFDSADPAYSNNGSYDPTKTKDNGDVGTNLTIENSLNVGNADIYGHVSTGPGGGVSVGANGSVGDKPWHLAGNKGIQPGARTDDMNVSFPDVTPPFTGGTIPGSGTTGGTNYSYVLGSGNYMLPELDLKGQHKMAVTGAAVLYVTGDLALGGNAFIYIAPGAKLQLYVGGASADFAGNGVANSGGNATNFYYYGLPSNTSLKLSGNSAFTGAIYAPNADFTLGGGGSDPYDFVGASVTGTVRLNGHYNFHYDENLERVGPRNGVVITSWNEI